MARIYYLLTFMIVTILLFNFAGLSEGGATSQLLSWAGITEPQNFQSSSFYLALVLIFTGIIGGGAIAIGFITKDSNTIVLISSATLAIGMLVLAADMGFIFMKLVDFNKTVATLVFAPLIISWLLVIYDWWRGVN